MQRLLPREPVDQLQDNSGGRVGIKDRLRGLGRHLVNNLQSNANGRPLVVCNDSEELKVENVEVRVLVYRNLLQQRLAQYGDRDGLYLLIKRQELPYELLPDISILMKLDEQER